MTLERISAFITYCIAVVLAWLGDLSIKDASTLGGLMIGVLMLAINWYYKHKAYQLLRDGQISCNFAFFSGLIGAQFWAERVQPKSPELDAKLLVSC